jgi:hypothetical protein
MTNSDVLRLDGSAVVRKSAAHKYDQNPAAPDGQYHRISTTRRLLAVPHPRGQTARAKVQEIRVAAPAEGTRYRAKLPIMVLAFRDNHHAAVTIPANHVFEVIGTDHDDRFVIVRVRGEEFLVFASDLHDRGTRDDESVPLLAEYATA